MTFTDATAPVVALAPCRALDAQTVTCSVKRGHSLSSAPVTLGDLNDRFAATIASDDVLEVDAGPGDDEVHGSRGHDAQRG